MPDADELKDLLKDGRKIEAIKKLRDRDGCSLAEAKSQVEELQRLMIEAGELDPAKAKSGCGGAAAVLVAAIVLLAAAW